MKETGEHRILKVLWNGKFHYTRELSDAVNQYNARILGLRAKGIDILSLKNEKGCDGFKLITPKKQIDYETRKKIIQEEIFEKTI